MPVKLAVRGAIGLLLTTGIAVPSEAWICADPLLPPCCPSPCPVIDPARVAKLLADVDSVKQSIALESQIVEAARQMRDSVGGAVSAAQSFGAQLSNLGGTISGELTSPQVGLPASPAAALGTIRQAFFSASGSQSTASQDLAIAQSRQGAVQAEEMGGYAVSLMRSAAMTSTNLGPLAPKTTQELRGDVARNSLSRLQTYQSVNRIHQLVAAWLSQRSAEAASKHSVIAGGSIAVSSPPPATSSDMGNDQAVFKMLNQLVSLHDARVEAQALLSSYPALEQTLASAVLAKQFSDGAETRLKQALLAAGMSGALLPDIQKSLLSLDRSGWLDSGKDAGSVQAAAAVLAALTPSKSSSAEEDPGMAQLQSAMTSWLDADKQSRYWGSLSADAQNVIGVLDTHLGALSDRMGIDVAGVPAAFREQILLKQLSDEPGASRWDKLISAARQDPAARTVLIQAGMQ